MKSKQRNRVNLLLLLPRLDGKVKKFLAEITLLGQAFVKNPDQTVQAYLQENKTQIFDFIDLHVGEGIEKKTVDYAAEVAAAAKV